MAFQVPKFYKARMFNRPPDTLQLVIETYDLRLGGQKLNYCLMVRTESIIDVHLFSVQLRFIINLEGSVKSKECSVIVLVAI